MKLFLKRYGYVGIIFIVIGLLGILPRVLSLDAAWSSDESLWLFRSRDFMVSTLDGDFSSTLQSYHPGVTTMWLAGSSLWKKYKYALPNAHLLSRPPFLSLSNLARTRLTIAITTAITILITFFLLQKLLGREIATIASIFLAVDPILLAQSRRLHTDTLAADFLLLAILTLLIFIGNTPRRRYLIFSGVCFGLACLSKSNALILALWVPLLLTLFFRQTPFRIWFGRAIYTVYVWFGATCLTLFAFWPVFWGFQIPIAGLMIPVSSIVALVLIGVIIWSSRKLKHLTISEQVAQPWRSVLFSLLVGGVCFSIATTVVYKAVQPVAGGISQALANAHNLHHFFLGKIVYDPGWLFYPLALSIRSAPLTFPLFLVGFVTLWGLRRETQYVKVYRMYVALSIFVILFTFCISIGAKKFSRYLLPVFPVMDILAAVSLYVLVEKLLQLGSFKWLFKMKISMGKTLGMFAIGLVLFIQVIPVFSAHPYYGVYYNPLWKKTDITKVCTIGDASGLDIAAKYLNQKPNAENLMVRVSPLSAEFFGYYFKGKSYPRDRDPGTFPPDYEVVYIRDVQINRVYLDDIEGALEHVIRLNGVDYVWIYKTSSG